MKFITSRVKYIHIREGTKYLMCYIRYGIDVIGVESFKRFKESFSIGHWLVKLRNLIIFIHKWCQLNIRHFMFLKQWVVICVKLKSIFCVLFDLSKSFAVCRIGLGK